MMIASGWSLESTTSFARKLARKSVSPCFRIPAMCAHALAAVTHQPIDVILALAHIEGSGKLHVAAGVVVDRGHVPPLRKVRSLFGLVLRVDTENHRQVVVGAGQFFKG